MARLMSAAALTLVIVLLGNTGGLHTQDGADLREGYARSQLERSKRSTKSYRICLITGNGYGSGTTDQIYIRLASHKIQWPSFEALPQIELPANTKACTTISGEDIEGDVSDIQVFKDGSDSWYPVEIRVSVEGERGYIPCSWAEKCGSRHYLCRFSDNRIYEAIPCGSWTRE